MNYKKKLRDIISETLKKMNINYNNSVIIEMPKSKTNGDYSTNIAMNLTKILHDSPINIANKIKENINDECIEKIEVINPGFINIFIKKEALLSIIDEVLEKEANYGRSSIGNNQKINIEYVSANPTGTLHIGHARGATYGDNLSRILSFAGYDVTREYYINDAGNQMNNLGISIKERYKEQCGLEYSLPEDGYHGKEIVKIAEEIYKEYKDKKINENIEYFKKYGLNILLNGIKKDLDTYRVNFDIWSSEQSLYDRGLVDIIITQLKDSGKCYINENALWLKTSDYNDEKDRVLIKQDGTYTYLLPDIAYHCDKLNRGYDNLIDVLGADHHGYINRLKGSLSILGYDSEKLDIKILQMVRLLKNGEEIKMSKRTGKSMTMKDLIEEVGINGTRYFFSARSLDSPLDFNIDLATKQSNENPIYYIEYANARISSILKKVKNINVDDIKEYKTLENDMISGILIKISELNDIVESAALKRLPHLICGYVYDLATMFHAYYSNETFITDNEIYTKERIKLLKAIKIVINICLDLIGIIPKEEM